MSLGNTILEYVTTKKGGVMKRLVCTAAVFSFFPLIVFAGRPLSTDDSETVDKGAFEVEYGIEYVNGLTMRQI